ncbi:hypothetical protein ABIA33_005863, partial [Streptacidiphilus sp. MAP12-16]
QRRLLIDELASLAHVPTSLRSAGPSSSAAF